MKKSAPNKKPIAKKRITAKLDPNMPIRTINNLLAALAGGKFILITDRPLKIETDAVGISSRVEYFGMLEFAKHIGIPNEG